MRTVNAQTILSINIVWSEPSFPAYSMDSV